MNTLNKILKELSTTQKTQKELCDFLGIGKQAFSDWKSGKSSSYMKYLPQIADFFGVSVDYLLGKDSPSEQTSTNAMTTAIYKETLSLTAEETTIIKAFRSNPSFAQIVRSTMDALGINHEEKDVVS